jgi:nicotinamide riboside kinase
MEYNNIDTDKIVNEVYTAEAEGRTRPMTKQEIMRIRLAALSAIVRNMQEIVEKDHELVSAHHTKSI